MVMPSIIYWSGLIHLPISELFLDSWPALATLLQSVHFRWEQDRLIWELIWLILVQFCHYIQVILLFLFWALTPTLSWWWIGWSDFHNTSIAISTSHESYGGELLSKQKNYAKCYSVITFTFLGFNLLQWPFLMSCYQMRDTTILASIGSWMAIFSWPAAQWLLCFACFCNSLLFWAHVQYHIADIQIE
jgi:hypothetical protein